MNARTTRRLLHEGIVAGLLFLLAPASIHAVPRDKSGQNEFSAKIGGLVVSAQTGEFLKGVLVSLRLLQDEQSGEGPVITGVTGLDGKFLFSNLPAGDYELWMRKSAYHSRSNARQRISIRDKQSRKGLVTKLWRSAVIAGRVLDPEGEPLSGVRVRAFRGTYHDDQPLWESKSSALSDDQGDYRIFDLPAGKYLVGASIREPVAPKGALILEYGSVFHPNALRPSQAVPLKLMWGSQADIDLDLVPVQETSVAGVVLDGDTGRACGGCVVHVAAQEPTLLVGADHSVRVREDGTFAIHGLTPGTYRLNASTSGLRPKIAIQELQLTEGRVHELVMQVSSGRQITGSIDWAESAPEDMVNELRSRQVSVYLRPEPGSPSRLMRSAPVGLENSSFVLPGVLPGAYRLSLSPLPAGAYLRGASLSREKLHEPRFVVENAPFKEIRLTLGFDGATIRGTVNSGTKVIRGTTPSGKSSLDDSPQPQVMVVLGPRFRKDGFLTQAETRYTSSGSFVFRSVTPGAYTLFATVEHHRSEFEAPELRTSLEKVVRHIKIDPHEQMNVEIPLIGSVIGID